MPVTPEDLLIPRPSLGDTANIEEAVNPALERISAIMAPQDQGPWSTLPAATPARKGMRYLATDRAREYVCTGAEWLPVDAQEPLLTGLPTSAYDGQEVLLQQGAGVYWRLRRSGTAWLFVGGPPAYSFSSGINYSITPSGVYALVMPVRAGYYIIEWSLSIGVALGNPAEVSGRLTQSGNTLGDRVRHSMTAWGTLSGSRWFTLRGREQLELSAVPLAVLVSQDSAATTVTCTRADLKLTPLVVR